MMKQKYNQSLFMMIIVIQLLNLDSLEPLPKVADGATWFNVFCNTQTMTPDHQDRVEFNLWLHP